MNRMTMGIAALPLAIVLVAGCTTMGTGTAESANNAVTGVFAWKASGPDRGTMTATLNNGQTYQGPFYQITKQSTVDSLGPLWAGWGGGPGFRSRWMGWGAWGPDESFMTEYTGKAVANLSGPGGQMRCHFTLFQPSSGMSGGGTGRCQLADGTIIHADFPAST